MSLTKQFLTSIYKFHDYPQLILNKGSRAIVYFLVFTLLTAVISIIPMAKAYYDGGGMSGFINKYIPEFEIKDGKLKCTPIDMDDETALIYINTDEEFDINAKAAGAQTYIIANSDSFMINNGIQTKQGNFADMEDISKADFINLVNSKEFKTAMYIGAGFGAIFIFLLAGIVNVLVILLLGSIVNSIFVKTQIGAKKMLKLAIYARTFPELLSILAALIGFDMPAIIVYGITATYLYLGLKNIKSGSGIILARID